MKPIEFKDQTCIYAKDQPQYMPLPVHKSKDGNVTSCWSLTWKERMHLLFTGKVWITLMTFNKPLQPQMLQVYDPFDNNDVELT